MESNPVFEEKVYLQSTQTFVQYHAHKSGPLKNLDKQVLKDVLKQVTFKRCKAGQKLNNLYGAYIYYGSIVKKTS